MLVLVTGGSGSGKSEFAENLAVGLGGELTYIAVMKPTDEESVRRIERHRKMRSGKGFKTVERYTDIKNFEASGTAVLECMSNLLANEMFGDSGSMAVEEILKGVKCLRKSCNNLVIVTNEISSDGIEHLGDTKQYMKNLGEINREIAKTADAVYEIICGRENRLK